MRDDSDDDEERTMMTKNQNHQRDFPTFHSLKLSRLFSALALSHRPPFTLLREYPGHEVGQNVREVVLRDESSGESARKELLAASVPNIRPGRNVRQGE